MNTSYSLQSTPDGIKTLIQTNPVAESVFFHLAGRRNNARETLTVTYENLMRAQGVERAAITKVWRQLEQEQLGRFIEGRHGRESRFAWSVPTRDFCGQAILSL